MESEKLQVSKKWVKNVIYTLIKNKLKEKDEGELDINISAAVVDLLTRYASELVHLIGLQSNANLEAEKKDQGSKSEITRVTKGTVMQALLDQELEFLFPLIDQSAKSTVVPFEKPKKKKKLGKLTAEELQKLAQEQDRLLNLNN
eukprot:maker-scaffold_6-snap-gene-0.54-mRNA-1 protein AED:0.00 eAED:0.00 QI:42/1/1/1/0/0/2/53/144